MVSILHFVPDEAKPGDLIARLRDATAPGSHLVVSHLTLDGVPAAPVQQGQQVYQRSNAPIVPRTRGRTSCTCSTVMSCSTRVWCGSATGGPTKATSTCRTATAASASNAAADPEPATAASAATAAAWSRRRPRQPRQLGAGGVGGVGGNRGS